MNNFKDLVLKNRSYRRFYENERIKESTILELIDLARQTPSAANKQPLKYFFSNNPDKNQKIFESLAFAGYLKDWKGPVKGERPSAYIVILRDRAIPYPCEIDHGIAAQTILLGAVEKGLGGCMIAAVNKKKLTEVIEFEEDYEILLVLAIGKPKENVIVEEINKDGDIRYYRDQMEVHHVPKRSLGEIIFKKSVK